jgi:ATP-dependent exoDNAse (exonuclease V) beta subunit
VLAAASSDSARASTWRRTSVTRALREARAEAAIYDLPGSGAGDEARTLGTVLHRVIEAAGRGRRGDSLCAFAAAVAQEEELSAATTTRLLNSIDDLLAVPDIQHAISAAGALFELPMMRATAGEDGLALVEGVIDAARPDGGGWEVLDWKLGGSGMEKRSDYQRQVEEYVWMLAAISGRPVEGRVVAVPLP